LKYTHARIFCSFERPVSGDETILPILFSLPFSLEKELMWTGVTRMLISAGAGLFFWMISINTLCADDWSPLWSTSDLSQARLGVAAASAGDKVLFGGGADYQATVDIFDTATNTWSVSSLSQGRGTLAAASNGSKAFFGGGISNITMDSISFSSVVDVFDSATNSWSTAYLGQPRGFLAAASAGDKVCFGGGEYNDTLGLPSNMVDIYNTTTNSWSQSHLSQARMLLSATSAGNKVIFAGGGNGAGSSGSTKADIYDTVTNTWSTADLSQGRMWLAATAAGTKAFFAGGYWYSNGDHYSNVVDIYDTLTNSWSTAKLSAARCCLAATSVGNKVLFAGGGILGGGSDVVDIYDTVSNTWSTAKLSQARRGLAATTVGNKAFFGGGGDSTASNVVDIYTLQSYQTIVSVKSWTLVDQTTVVGRMQLNSGASLNLDGYDLTVGSMGGVAPINLSTHMLTAGSDNTDSTYSGSISGNGTLVKTGSGILSLSGSDSYLGMTTVNMGELDLIGQDAWNPITNLSGAYLTGGELVFEYASSTNPYGTILGLMGTKITGSASLYVTDDAANSRVIVSVVPEPSVITLISVGVLGLLVHAWRRRV
jgi:autotransporter-associated beta strand protein